MTQAFNLSQLANKVNTSGQLDVSTGASGTLPIANGGTNNGALSVTAGGVIYTDGSKQVNSGAGTNGQVLLSSGAGAPTWGTLSASGALNNIQYFTTSGTYTPTSGTSFVIVELVGGGGGSISSVGGGSAGVGGTSSFGALVSATGGGAGNSTSYSNGGLGSSGDLNLQGGYGAKGSSSGLATVFASYGGSSPVFGTSNAALSAITNSAQVFIGNGLNYGNGAGIRISYSSVDYFGGSGAGGGYAKKKIISSFSGVTITVGASGIAGSNGFAGGQGIVIVYEYK